MTAIDFLNAVLSFSTEYPGFNSLEVKMDPLYKKSLKLSSNITLLLGLGSPNNNSPVVVGAPGYGFHGYGVMPHLLS